jgi:DNA-binding IclR family transcriptional regulator
MRAVGECREHGCSISEAGQRTGLHIATVKRIMGAMTQEGLLIRDEKTKKYFISYGLYLLCSQSHLPRLKDQLHPHLVRVAEDSEDTAFLIVPVGYDAMCIDRVEGNYPIRTQTFNIGDRRPLGIGAGGLALLSTYPSDQTARIIKANEFNYQAHNNRTADDIRAFVKKTRKDGFAYSVGNVTKGASSVAVPMVDGNGEAFAAIAIAAVNERMKKARRLKLVEIIKNEINVIQQPSVW